MHPTASTYEPRNVLVEPLPYAIESRLGANKRIPSTVLSFTFQGRTIKDAVPPQRTPTSSFGKRFSLTENLASYRSNTQRLLSLENNGTRETKPVSIYRQKQLGNVFTRRVQRTYSTRTRPESLCSRNFTYTFKGNYRNLRFRFVRNYRYPRGRVTVNFSRFRFAK